MELLFHGPWENGRVALGSGGPPWTTPTSRQLAGKSPWDAQAEGPQATLNHKPGGASPTPAGSRGEGQEEKRGETEIQVIWMKVLGTSKLSPIKRKLRKLYFCTSKLSCGNFKFTREKQRKRFMWRPSVLVFALRHLHPSSGGERRLTGHHLRSMCPL